MINETINTDKNKKPPLHKDRSICPKCQGLPLRYKLVEDDSLVGAHYVGIMCRECNGEGQV